jgi:hypothetical protein
MICYKREGFGLLEELAIRVCEFGLLVVELGLGSLGGWHTHTIDAVCACLSRNTPVLSTVCPLGCTVVQSCQTSDSFLFLRPWSLADDVY